jgi:hypothetical protein
VSAVGPKRASRTVSSHQWGSCGAIDYRAEAERVIVAIAAHELDPTQRFVQPGDWPSDGEWSRVMRSSDFMPGHFAAFSAAMGEAWASGGAGGTDDEGSAGAEGAGGAGGASRGGEAGAATGAGGAGGASSDGEAGAATGGVAGANAGDTASGGSASGGTASGGTPMSAGGTWGTLLDSVYASFTEVQANHASETGLVPDYVLDSADAPAPAVDLPRDAQTEDPWDEHYAWNACRVPWRVGVHYLITGDARARALLEPINVWAEATTEGEPLDFAAGYALDGTPLPGQQFPAMAFIAPLGVSAMNGADQQEWLDAIWSAVVATEPEDYYSDSVKLLSMIAMSRGWWVPEAVGEECE